MSGAQRLGSAMAAALVALLVLTLTPSPVAAEVTYTVQPGDTLSVIARDHGVSTNALAEANGIANQHLIRVGQVLSVPVAEPVSYTVQSGDTISEIAAAMGVSVADIVAVNGLSDANRIRVGQELLLPAGAGSSGPSEIDVLRSRYPSLPNSIASRPERVALIPSFERWAAHYGVPTDLLMAMAYQESGWQTAVVSNKGAIGVGQILPGTAEWIADDLIGLELDPYDPDDNIRMSARFLAWLIGYLGGEDIGLAGYYQGPGSVTLRGLYGETEAYVANVQGARWRFQPG